MTHISSVPDPNITLGLVAIALLVLMMPFLVKKVEENLEPFFLFMGVAAVTISNLWSGELVVDALKAPVMIGKLPIGIFQVVLIFGFLIHYFNDPFCNLVLHLEHKLGHKLFIFLLIAFFGMFSSVISVILTAVLLSEIAAALPITKKVKIELIVVSCFAVGLGAVLTPLGEPLSTLLVAKLDGAPYFAGFGFPFKHFAIYLIPGVFAVALFGALWLGPRVKAHRETHIAHHKEKVSAVTVRAAKVYLFVSALVLLGEGFKPLIVWYFQKIPGEALYWFNTISAVLDNATLTAVEIGPALTMTQITGIVMGLSIAGGMLVPGNIPNIVAACRLKINMKEWAKIGLPIGFALMAVYFVILYIL